MHKHIEFLYAFDYWFQFFVVFLQKIRNFFFSQLFRIFKYDKTFCDRKKNIFKTWNSYNLMCFNIELAKNEIFIWSTLFDTCFIIRFSFFTSYSLKISTLHNNVCFINSYNSFSIFNVSIFVFQNELVSSNTHDKRKFWFFNKFDTTKIVFFEYFEYDEEKKIVFVIYHCKKIFSIIFVFNHCECVNVNNIIKWTRNVVYLML